MMPLTSAPTAIRKIGQAAAWILLLCGISPCLPVAAEDTDATTPLFSDDGYRVAAFRAPVPQSAAGAVTVDTPQANELFNSGVALFIDVLPAPEKPQGLAPGALWMPLQRYNIPGSIWLPNVGYGRLSDELEAFFRTNLQRLTGGDLGRPLVIYCLADCWMSWNAARRAAVYGYTRVYWYPDGSDGWHAAGLPLKKSQPATLQRR